MRLFHALIALAILSTCTWTLADDTKPLRIRVLSYNIHHGEGTDGKFDLPRIAEVIKATNADIVALQEVDERTKRASGVDQAAELGKLTKMHHVFGKAMNYSGGAYGEAILSRWIFEKTRNHELPFTKGNEPRSAISATIRINETGPLFLFVGTHLDHLPKNTDRLAQARKLNELFVSDTALPTILVGDLNAEPKDEEIKLLREKWESAAETPGMKAAPTYPSDKPRIQIDHILFRPAKHWRVIEVKVIDEKVASDHCPLLAVLEYVP